MTLFDVEMQYAYWAEHPPLGLMIEGFLGVKAAGTRLETRVGTTATNDQAAQLMALTGAPGVATANVASWEAFHAAVGLAAPIFDKAELMERRPT